MIRSPAYVSNALKNHSKRLRKRRGVVAVGIGKKIVNGEDTGRVAIVVSVEKKLPKGQLRMADVIPATIDGAETDVVETGVYRVLTLRPEDITDQSIYTERHRPAPGGVSIGHFLITAGTFGVRVFDRATGEALILSNNHVLANSNDAQIGDAILQPGPYDGGSDGDVIGKLLRFVAVDFGGGIPITCPISNAIVKVLNYLTGLFDSSVEFSAKSKIFAEGNLVDCALCEPTLEGDIVAEILNIGEPLGFRPGELGMKIKKTGRTTGFTEGEIIQTDVTAQVQYGEGKVATFTDQLMAGAISQGGDSGSAIMDQDNRLVGLLFAGSDTTTIINRVEHVMDQLQVNV